MKRKILLIALAAVCVVFSPTARAQDTQSAPLEFTPVPVVVANAHDADFVDTETQPHILVAINMDPPDPTGGPLSPLHEPPPALVVAHTVYFPSGDSVLVDRGTVMQIAVTATTELALQPADGGGTILPPPDP